MKYEILIKIHCLIKPVLEETFMTKKASEFSLLFRALLSVFCFLLSMNLTVFLSSCDNRTKPDKPLWKNHFDVPLQPDTLELPLHKKSKLRGNTARKKPLVLFLGFDGATWVVIKPLMEQGKLPNLQRLCNSGSYGRLKTDVGLSPVSWTSIMTGVGSERHGIFAEEAWENMYRKQVHHIWDLLAAKGWRIGIVGYPFLLEKYAPKGAFFWTPTNENEVVFEHHNEDYHTYIVDGLFDAADHMYLMEHRTYDACFSLFSDTDIVQHRAYQQFCIDEFIGIDNLDAAPGVLKNIRRDAESVRRVYALTDLVLGALLRLTPDYIFIASDHGFKNDRIVMNVELKELFFKKLGLKIDNYGQDGSARFPVYSGVENESYRLHRADNLPAFVSHNSGAVSYPWAALRNSNVKIRSELEYPRFEFEYRELPVPRSFTKLKRKASKMKCGGVRCLNVQKSEKTLDLQLSDEVINRIKDGHTAWDEFEINKYTGMHNAETPGIFIMAGPGIRAGQEVKGAELYDLVPTLLYLLGEPVARDFDGKVLVEAISHSYLNSHPVQFIDTYGRPKTTHGETREIPSEERKRLKALGYL